VSLTEIGGQNLLYESQDFPKNCVEKEILCRVEDDFFSARKRIVEEKAVRREADREAIRRYLAAQVLRQGHLHKRLVQLEKDMRFLAKEMNLERRWRLDDMPETGARKRASSVLAKGLSALDDAVGDLKDCKVVFIERAEADLILPDRGFVQIYEENGHVRADGLRSPSFEVFLPLSPGAAVRIYRTKAKRIRASVRLGDEGYGLYLRNLGLNANEFVVGKKTTLSSIDWSLLPSMDADAERASMILQIVKAGEFDRVVEAFSASNASEISALSARRWFYREILTPAFNKLFNPDGSPEAETIYLAI
jgi:hypothetical protein